MSGLKRSQGEDDPHGHMGESGPSSVVSAYSRPNTGKGGCGLSGEVRTCIQKGGSRDP